MKIRSALAVAVGLVLSCAAASSVAPPVAATGSETPSVTLVEVGRFELPVGLAWRVDDPALYVVEQGGRVVQLAEDGTTELVLDLDRS